MFNFSSFLKILPFIIVCNILGQTNENLSWKYALSAGPGLPVGDFAKVDGQNSGMATIGLFLFFDYTNPLNKDFSWYSSVGLSVNPLDEDEFNKQVKNDFGSSASATTGSYVNLWLLSGVKFESPVSETASFLANIPIGLVSAAFPAFTITGAPVSATFETKTALAFAFNIGAGYHVNNFLFGLNFTSAKPKFEQKFTSGSFSTTSNIEISQSILRFSVGYIF